MKKHLLLLTAFLSLTIAYGQSIQTNFIGIKGGLNWMTTTLPHSDQYSEIEMQYKNGFAVGFTYEHVGQNSFSFSTAVLYDQRGYKYYERQHANNGGYIIFYDYHGNLIGDRILHEYRYKYLSIPLKIGFRFGKRLSVSMHAGLLPSLTVGATCISYYWGHWSGITGTGELQFVGNKSTSASRLNLAGVASIGTDYKLKERVWLTMDFSYQHDITRINSRIRLYGMTLNFGVKFSLGKKEY
jgi:hypothetical protein